MSGETLASSLKPSAETTSGTGMNNSNSNKADDFAVKVRPEFVLTERSPVLTPEKPVNTVTPASSDNGNGNDRRNNKKSRRGQNKKRPRDAKIAQADKVCLAIVRGEECPFGPEKCKYNHDLKEILANRPEDIQGIDGYLKEEGCPAWRLRGYCDFGVMCRVGSCHINMSTGQNLRKSVDESKDDASQNDDAGEEKNTTETETSQPKVQLAIGHQNDIKNVISRDTMVKLRKNTYPFVCKRHFEVAKEKQKQKKNEEAPKTDDADREHLTTTQAKSVGDATTPALPLKERKLIDFRNKVYIAPLTTVGNLPFRRIMKQFGADITCGEMALADQLLQGKASEWALLKRHPSEDVFGVQIAAGHADQYTRIAEVLTNEEGFEIDFVDMNLGCPIDLVCEKGAGASLMLREKKLRGSVEGLTKVLNCPVTIKMRTGWDEKKNFAHNLVPNIQKWGIEGIGAFMIHGRSRLQRYSRLADWDYIAQVASSQSSDYPKIPVIGNGDIFSYNDYEETILKRVGEDGDTDNMLLPTAMLGRGALIKPWLPTEIKERRHWDISATERLDMLKDFVRYGLEHYGSDQQGVNNTRRFLLEWLSFLHRYVPVGMLEVLPQQMNHRPPQNMCGRNDLETLMLSKNCADWIKISEMLLGPVPEDFQFVPKHKANSY